MNVKEADTIRSLLIPWINIKAAAIISERNHITRIFEQKLSFYLKGPLSVVSQLSVVYIYIAKF